MTVYTIKEYDHTYKETMIIGVADSVEKVDEMIDEFYGNDINVEQYHDVREHGIQYVKDFELFDLDGISTYNVTVTVEYFKLNEI